MNVRRLCLAAGVLALWPAAAGARPLRVGSKAFTESVILGEIATRAERAAGLDAQHRSALGGTRLLWDALLKGAIDVYPEYTGTLRQEVLASDRTLETAPRGDRRPLARALAAHGVGMTAPLGFDNTYAIGVLASRAQALGLARISDLRAHPDLTFGFSSEFVSRRDGWPALRRHYDLPQANVRGLDHDLAYEALRDGTIDATDIYTTDAEIRRFGLVPLADDREFFMPYQAVLLYRLDVADRFGPRAVAALQGLAGRIDGATMVSLNARAKIDRVPEADVAAAFLAGQAPAGGLAPRRLSWRSVGPRVLEHLALVGLSLIAAILLAVPLGVLAAKRPRLGQPVLAATGVIQTVPTLALLVFMIPLFGIGTLPAVVALFLYALLPIVRNTHAGISGIPQQVRESAEALGLPPGAILRRVEMPLASPLILAGIQSAAVIDVGAATLGALIGAGGLGQPIFTGIRLDDLALVLAGAVPASLLALLVQALFELAARLLVPRGLRAPKSR